MIIFNQILILLEINYQKINLEIAIQFEVKFDHQFESKKEVQK